MDVLAAAALAGLSALSFLLVRRVRGLLEDVAQLSGRVEELADRLGAAEQDVSAAIGRTEVAETVLLEKGLADEDDLEAARRRFDEAAESASGEGELH
jgi:membrane protein implicated in regulation of membrane protease activity